ncbi:MAG: hypothetical protein R3F49_15090 [Planctomycetota bacterium]
MSGPDRIDAAADADGAEEAPRVEHDVHDFTGPLSPAVARLLRVFGALCLLFFALDFVIDRGGHGAGEHPPGEGIPGFYAVYGFAGCVLLVLVAKEMRKVVMRDEDYYERAARVSPAPVEPSGEEH